MVVSLTFLFLLSLVSPGQVVPLNGPSTSSSPPATPSPLPNSTVTPKSTQSVAESKRHTYTLPYDPVLPDLEVEPSFNDHLNGHYSLLHSPKWDLPELSDPSANDLDDGDFALTEAAKYEEVEEAPEAKPPSMDDILNRAPLSEHISEGDPFQAKLYDDEAYECVRVKPRAPTRTSKHFDLDLSEKQVHHLYGVEMSQEAPRKVAATPRPKLKDFGNFIYVEDSTHRPPPSSPSYSYPVEKKAHSYRSKKTHPPPPSPPSFADYHSGKWEPSTKPEEVDALFGKLKVSLDKLLCYETEECASLGANKKEKIDHFLRHIRLSKRVFDLLEAHRHTHSPPPPQSEEYTDDTEGENEYESITVTGEPVSLYSDNNERREKAPYRTTRRPVTFYEIPKGRLPTATVVLASSAPAPSVKHRKKPALPPSPPRPPSPPSSSLRPLFASFPLPLPLPVPPSIRYVSSGLIGGSLGRQAKLTGKSFGKQLISSFIASTTGSGGGGDESGSGSSSSFFLNRDSSFVPKQNWLWPLQTQSEGEQQQKTASGENGASPGVGATAAVVGTVAPVISPRRSAFFAAWPKPVLVIKEYEEYAE